MNFEDEITLDDLVAVSIALEGWIDAFGEDDTFDEGTIASVKKISRKIDLLLERAKASGASHLRLVKPTEIH